MAQRRHCGRRDSEPSHLDASLRTVLNAARRSTMSFPLADSFVDSSFVFDRTRSDIMARWRQAVELGMIDEEIGTLAAMSDDGRPVFAPPQRTRDSPGK